jgi:hypothetical protein
MPRFEFEISVVLVVFVFFSLMALWIAREKDGRVKLPSHLGDEGVGGAGGLARDGYLPGVDPFDVTKPEDIMDGYPIDEDGFWRRVSWIEWRIHRF